MIAISEQLKSLLCHRTHRFATCWQITRTDGTIFRFTSHDKEIFTAGYTYTPVGGYSVSAMRHEAGLKGQDRECIGVLSSAAITTDDLRAGLYRNAEVIEYLVNWRYPWAEAFYSMKYWINETSFDGTMWQADLIGLSSRLEQPIGNVFNKTCRYDFASTRCGKTAATYTVDTVAVERLDVQRLSFYADSATLPTQDDNYYAYGNVTWTSGANDGLSMDVKTYTDSVRKITLVLPMPFDIAIGDEFSIIAGCDKTFTTCTDTYDNAVNFGGYPYLPGTDSIMETPDAGG